MNNISFEDFKKTESYQKFSDNNKGSGNLNIRAYTANEAIPISNLEVIVSLIVDNYNVIFFRGKTDDSGMIPRITLPAPIYNPDNLVAPLFTTYDVLSKYNDKEYKYKVNLYDDICVVQTINIVPEIMERKEFYYGG